MSVLDHGDKSCTILGGDVNIVAISVLRDELSDVLSVLSFRSFVFLHDVPYSSIVVHGKVRSTGANSGHSTMVVATTAPQRVLHSIRGG